MIAPDKYVSLNASLIGVGAAMLRRLTEPVTITAFWEACRELPEIRTFTRFVLALDLLYALGAIDVDSGQVVRLHT
jgi:hypothetical protein